MELLTLDEVQARLDEIPAEGKEYEALCFLRRAYYLEAEGFIEIENGHLYATDA